jgi:arylsulfatase A-like enzyme
LKLFGIALPIALASSLLIGLRPWESPPVTAETFGAVPSQEPLGSSVESQAEQDPLAELPLDAIPHPYNVLLISIDTARRDHFSCYGYRHPTTPHLDAFASASGLLYTNCSSVSNWTLPSHASMLSGLYPRSHGARFLSFDEAGDAGYGGPRMQMDAEIPPHTKLPSSCLTLPEALHQVGYRTGAILANHTFLDRRFGLDQGFDLYDSRKAEGDRPYRDAIEIVDEAIGWIRNGRQTPYFLFLNLMEPHAPYIPPPRFAHRFAEAQADDEMLAGWSWDIYRQTERQVMAAGEPLSERVRASFQAWYDGEIAFADEQIGRLFEWLREEGRFDETLIIVTSDHGESLGEHQLIGHGNAMYDPEVAIPLILKLPHDHRRGEVLEYPVQQVDLMPTILEVLELPLNVPLQGVSLLRPTPDRSMIAEEFAHHPMLPIYWPNLKHAQRMLVRGKLKFIEYFDGQRELFDVGRDPEEINNLADARAQETQLLQSALREWMKQTVVFGDHRVAPLDPAALRDLRTLGYVQ